MKGDLLAPDGLLLRRGPPPLEEGLVELFEELDGDLPPLGLGFRLDASQRLPVGPHQADHVHGRGLGDHVVLEGQGDFLFREDQAVERVLVVQPRHQVGALEGGGDLRMLLEESAQVRAALV